jgi:putative lipoprotein
MVAEPMVIGTLELPEDAELPDGATWSVQLQDTSLADAPAEVIAEEGGDVEDAVAGEIVFAISYDPEAIVDTNTYTLQARIEDETGFLLYVNDTHVPVLTDEFETTNVTFPVVAVEALPAESMVAEESPPA